jgi:hypothetical protein
MIRTAQEERMDTVTATGTVKLADNGQPVLVPTGPAGDEPPLALDLLGPDLPPVDARVVVEGELNGRSLQAARWQPKPAETSASGIPDDMAGVTPEDAEAILNRVPEDWPIISTGETTVASGKQVVTLEVERITPEMQRWYEQQPLGSVHLVAFIESA